MAENKGVILVGVDHEDRFLDHIKKVIDCYIGNVKTIAIEGIFAHQERIFNNWAGKMPQERAPKSELYKKAEKVGLDWFWVRVAVHAAEKGLKIVSIDSMYASEKAQMLLELADIGLAGARKKAEILAKPLREEFMVKRIKKLSPDIVIVGSGHIGAIKKAVPVKHLAFVGWPTGPVFRVRSRLRKLQLNMHRKKQSLRRRH